MIRAAIYLQVNIRWLAEDVGPMEAGAERDLSAVMKDTVTGFVPTIAETMGNLSTLLRSVPREERDAVGRKLASLAVAPDSAELMEDIKAAIERARVSAMLQGASVETNDLLRKKAAP